jgi:hypothetical protein
MRVNPLSLLVVVLVFAAATPAAATTMLPLSLRDLVDRSDVVVHVRVGAIRVVQGQGAPYRVTELVVVEAFQGARRGETLELWQRGDGALFVVGDPILEEGQEGVAFLRRVDGRIYLTALAQAFWWIDGQGEQALARRDLGAISILLAGEPTALPPDLAPWSELRRMILDACLGVTP